MEKRHPMRMAVEVVLIILLLGWGVYRWTHDNRHRIAVDDTPKTPSRVGDWAREQMGALQRPNLSFDPEVEEGGLPTDWLEEEGLDPADSVQRGQLFARVVPAAASLVPTSWWLISHDFGTSNRLDTAVAWLELRPGTYRFGAACTDVDGQYWEAGPLTVEVTMDRPARLELPLRPVISSYAESLMQLRPMEDWFEVLSVREGSGAEVAGIRAGDVIIEINGLSTTSLTGAEAERLLRRVPGGATRVVLAMPEGDGFRAVPITIPH